VGTVLGDLLPLTVGVAVSPVPIIAVILMLLAPRASAASVAFAVGWVLGIAAVTVLALLLSGGTDVADDQAGPSTGSSWVKLLLGLALLAVGAKQWRGRPKPGQDVALPKWMAAIDHVTPVRALALGFPVVLVSDAHTSAGNAAIGPQQVIAHHNATLTNISSFGPRVRAMGSEALEFANGT